MNTKTNPRKRAAEPTTSNEMAPTGRAWVFAGKGGTGKSALLNAMSSLAAMHGRPHKIYDMDDSNPTASRFFSLPDEQIVGSVVESEVGEIFAERIWPCVEAREDVLVDLGGSGEVPLLRWCGKTDASALTGDRLVFVVVVGSVDSLGTARTVVENATANPVILFVNKSIREHALATQSPEFAPTFQEICDAQNVRAIAEFPDVGYALAASSRSSKSIYDVSRSPDVGMFERGASLKALRVLDEAFAPLAEWLP